MARRPRATRLCARCGRIYDTVERNRRTLCMRCWRCQPGIAWLRFGLASLEVKAAADRERAGLR